MLDRYAFPSLRYHLLRLFDAKDQAERLMNDLLKFPLARQDQVRRCRWGLGLEGLQLGSRSARPLLALVAFDAGMADRSRRGLLFGETGPILAKRMSRGRLGIVRVKTLPCACAGGFEDGAMDGCNAQLPVTRQRQGAGLGRP
jgi:hypothetical protein